MRYRTVGKTGVKVSQLGFGCMRLPVIDGHPDKIDYEQGTEMLHYAIEQGVNYVDTAYFYHGTVMGQRGESEPFVGAALAGGWRERVNLATKLPVAILKTREQMDALLAEQLERLQTDHLDFYLLHGLDGASWDRVRDMGVIEFLEGALADGLIRFPAFSFHGSTADFKRICDEYDNFAFAQIQYNYMDVGFQAGYEGLRYAVDKGMGLVVMEPIKGGKLAHNLPPEMQAVFDERAEDWSPAEWALRYVWNEPGVSLLLSGMSSMDQVVENVRVANEAQPETLSAEELSVYERARVALAARMKADCTACRYCMPCPNGVDIPGVLAALNNASMWDDPNPWLTGYLRVEGKAGLCVACRECEDMCPQGLPISDLMAEAHKVFGS